MNDIADGVVKLRNRLFDILNRHVRHTDRDLSDREFVEAVVKRHEKTFDQYIIDVNE